MLKNFFKKVTAVVAGRQLDDEVLDELEEQLIISDVSLDTASHLIEALRGAAKRGEVPTDGDIEKFLQREISILLGGGTHPLQTNPQGITVWLFVGVNGVGKTTSVGKLAHRLVQRGHKPLLIAGDTFR